MTNKVAQKLISLIFAVSLALFILSFSIAIPIFCRPFYYAQIEPLNLPQVSGFTTEQIRTSYDAVLDYLTLPNREFSVGDMAYTSQGAEHFADVKALFNLNTGVLIGSAICVTLLLLLRFFGKINALSLGRRSAAFYSGVSAIVLPLAIGLLASIDFNTAFVIFHKIFFPGKDNWLFDPSTDQIITVLPEEFFMNCAIIIGASVIVLSFAVIIADLVKKRKNQVDFKTKV